MNSYKEKMNLLFKREGTCQSERLVPQLINNGFLINGKQLSDHIIFVYLYSDLIQYYNAQNEPVDLNIWRTFLENDDTVILSLIWHTRLTSLSIPINKDFVALKRQRTSSSDNKYTKNLLTILEEFIILLNYWYSNLSDTHNVKLELYNIITHELNERITQLFKRLKECCKQTYSETFFNFCAFIEHICKERGPWYLIPGIMHQSLDETSADQIVTLLRELFDLIFSTINNLQHLSREFYYKTLTNQQHKPQVALLIAFLKLLEYATAHLNQIPQRHLDYYYRDVLRFKNRPIRSDSVHVHFKLKEGIGHYFLPKGSKLLAGKDEEGRELIFKTNRAVTLNQGSIEKIHVLHRIKKKKHEHSNGATPPVQLNMATYSADALNKQSLTLGCVETESTMQPNRVYYHLGLLVASPLFYLKEGKREIKIAYKLRKESFEELKKRATMAFGNKPGTYWNILEAMLAKALSVQLTAEESWINLSQNDVKIRILEEQTCLEFTLSITPDIPPIVAFNQAVHQEPYEISSSAVRILLKNDDNYLGSIYFFGQLELEKIDLQVRVVDYRGLILQNDLGLVDNSQIFQPFGPMPKLHANLYIGSNEIFCKNLKQLKINITWEDLPTMDDGFKRYYAAYPGKVTNKDFKVSISYLNHRKWHPFAPESRQQIRLFTFEKDDKSGIEKLQNKRIISEIDIDQLAITRAKEPLHISLCTPQTLSGFLKLRLCSPEMAFGHALYPTMMGRILTHNIIKNQKKPEQMLPLNTPYTPLIKSLSIDYCASESMLLTRKTSESEYAYNNTFLRILPFGYKKLFPHESSTPITLLPDTNREECYICFGIKNLNTFSLSLHIQINESNIDPDKDAVKSSWQYLSQNDWIDFKEDYIISDGTNGLTKSGILVLTIPQEANTDNTTLRTGFTWIKARFLGDLDALPDIVGIYPQAVTASRVIDDASISKQYTLPAYAIQHMRVQPVEIDAAVQPFESFGGKPAEDGIKFYTRVSERLRHKNRAVSTWDYERIVLEAFPEIFRVKCINHAKKDTLFKAQPGRVLIVVIKTISKHITRKALLPKADKQLLEEIKHHLEKVASPFVNFEVINPVYEEVKVNVEVKLKQGYEKGVFLNKLQKEIKFFLSPWLFNKPEDIKLGGVIPTSKIMAFINKRAYVESIGNFSVLRYTGEGDTLTISKIAHYDNYLKATYPWSVMVSADRHEIAVVDNFELHSRLRHGGMEDMSVGKDFIIGPWQEVKETGLEVNTKEEELKESLEQYYLVTKKYIKKTNYGHS